jgi:hypothetical protein
MSVNEPMSGGCQCGAIRFRAGKLGRPSICHCRMCQKAFGSFFGPFVTADQAHLEWTRGQPNWFKSSNKVHRGFCARCGTQLAYRHPGGIEMSIGGFDEAEKLEPEVQVNYHQRLPWIDRLFDKPRIEGEPHASFFATIESYQHPDHDTDKWPEEEK